MERPVKPEKIEKPVKQEKIEDQVISSTPEIEFEPILINPDNYEARRLQNKLGYFASGCMIFQNITELSLFTLYVPLSSVGLYLGFIITVLVGYFTVYGLMFIEKSAQFVERLNGNVRKVKNTNEICEAIDSKYSTVLKWAFLIGILGEMVASTISYIQLIGRVFFIDS